MITPTTEQIQYAKYKWEFLRRKPKFLAYCKKYRTNGEDYIPIDRPWGLTRIIDPSLSYEEHVKRFDEDNTMRSQEDSSTDEIKFLSPGETDITVAVRNVDGHRLMFETLGIPLDSPVVSLDTLSLPLEYDAFLYSDLRSDDLPDGNLSTKLLNRSAETGFFTVRVNLAYSKNRILKEFQTILTELKTLYEGHLKESKQEEHTHKTKLHFDNYDDYLKVYDLRQEGKSWSKIKELLNLNSVQTARNHYGAACKRIEKGLDTYIE